MSSVNIKKYLKVSASLLILGSAAQAGTLAIGSTNAAAYSWAEILIPSLGPMGVAFGLNDKGQVAVTSADGSKTGIYRGGVFTPLPAPPTGYKVSALGMNDSATIVGSAFSPSDPTHEQGFILNGSKYVFFSQPGWDNTEPRAIANSGLITGYSATSDLSTTAGFIYDAGTNTFTDATPPGSGAGFSVTQGMNAQGRISGDGRSDELGRYAFVWQQKTLVRGTRQLAPFLTRLKIADENTAARGINDAGVIVGFTSSGVGFVGNDSRGYQPLIPPGGDATGASVGCEGINYYDQVVCSVTDAAGNNRNFIGTPNANYLDDQ
jgi:hypothetical protein